MAAAASCSATIPLEKHHVFLSFRGEDTRKTFTSHLFKALCWSKIRPYIDNKLERGDAIKPALQKAISESNSKKISSDAELVKLVIDDVLAKLNRKSQIASGLEGKVGLKRHVLKVESLLCPDSHDVRTVGIWGMGGSRKSTIPDFVYHRLPSEFEARCFVAHVRERSETRQGLNELRDQLLRTLLKEENLHIDTPLESTSIKEPSQCSSLKDPWKSTSLKYFRQRPAFKAAWKSKWESIFKDIVECPSFKESWECPGFKAHWESKLECMFQSLCGLKPETETYQDPWKQEFKSLNRIRAWGEVRGRRKAVPLSELRRDILYELLLSIEKARWFQDMSFNEGRLRMLQEIYGSCFEVHLYVVTKNLALSERALDDLVNLLQGANNVGKTVLPIFYGVDPSDVRKQTGSFAEAFASHEKTYKDEPLKVEMWRAALRELGNLAGWDSNSKHWIEGELIQDVVNETRRILCSSSFSKPPTRIKNMSSTPSWSSSCRRKRRRKHDVFLSFRGGDTRFNFLAPLYDELIQRRISTFRDDKDLRKGMDIRKQLEKAIEGANVWVVIVSPNYASSEWCLDELLKILECRNASEVGKKHANFMEASAKYEEQAHILVNAGNREKGKASLRNKENITNQNKRILVNYDGEWVNSTYVGGKTKGIIISEDVTYQELVDRVRDVVKVDPNEYKLIMKSAYKSNLPTQPVEIFDDDSLAFFIHDENLSLGMSSTLTLCTTLERREFPNGRMESSQSSSATSDMGASARVFPGGGVLDREKPVSFMGDSDPFFYLCGRFLSLNKPVVIPVFAAALVGIWNLQEKVLVREEEPGIFVFQFRSREVRDRVFGGGPWSFGGSMIVLAEYDGLRPVEEVSLKSMEVWVSVLGLRMAMRNTKVLTRIGNGIGTFIRDDPAAVQRKEKVQRVRVLLNLDKRIPASTLFDFSPEISVPLTFTVERCHGLCRKCGLFVHGGGWCDRGLVGMVVPSEVGTEHAGLEDGGGSTSTELEPLATAALPEVMATEGAAGMEGLQENAALRNHGEGEKVIPSISAGNPSFKLGLTRKEGLTEGCLLTGGSGLTKDDVGPTFGPEGADGLRQLKANGLDSFILSGPTGGARLEGLVKDLTPLKRKRVIKLTEKALGLIQEPKKKRGKPIGSKKFKPPKEVEPHAKAPTLLYNRPPPSPNLKGKDKI